MSELALRGTWSVVDYFIQELASLKEFKYISLDFVEILKPIFTKKGKAASCTP